MKLKLKQIGFILVGMLLAQSGWSHSFTLQDIVNEMAPLPTIVIYTDKEIVTLNPDRPKATAVAVVGKFIINKNSNIL